MHSQRGYISKEMFVFLIIASTMLAAGTVSTRIYMQWQKVVNTQEQMYEITKLALIDASSRQVFPTSYTDLQSRFAGLPTNNLFDNPFILRGDMRFAAVASKFPSGIGLVAHDYEEGVFTPTATADVWEIHVTQNLNLKNQMNEINNPNTGSWVDIW